VQSKRRLKQLPVVWNSQVQQLVDDDEILKRAGLIHQVLSEAHASEGGTRCPFSGHAHYDDLTWSNPELRRPPRHTRLKH
jgi:hypothetical protein